MRNKERCRLKFVSNPVPTIHIKFNHAISGVNAVGSGSAGGYSYEISKNENPIDQIPGPESYTYKNGVILDVFIPESDKKQYQYRSQVIFNAETGQIFNYILEIRKNEPNKYRFIDQDLLARFMCVPQPTS